jgi:hypothetical protein
MSHTRRGENGLLYLLKVLRDLGIKKTMDIYWLEAIPNFAARIKILQDKGEL